MLHGIDVFNSFLLLSFYSFSIVCEELLFFLFERGDGREERGGERDGGRLVSSEMMIDDDDDVDGDDE